MLCQRKFSKLLTSLGTWCHKDKTHNPNRCPQHQRANRAFCRLWWCRFTCSKLINSRRQDIANTEVTSREDLIIWLIASNFSQTKAIQLQVLKLSYPSQQGCHIINKLNKESTRQCDIQNLSRLFAFTRAKCKVSLPQGLVVRRCLQQTQQCPCGRNAEHDKNKSYCESDRETERHHHLNNLIWNNVMSKKVL